MTPEIAENSNAIALGLIGDEWNLAIVRLAIMSGVRRYKDFRDRLAIANSVLTARLRRLTEAGVFTMAQYSDAPRRYEYVLTNRGRDLSECVVFRAGDVGRGPIARAQLPERIASGTHSCWAPGDSLRGWA